MFFPKREMHRAALKADTSRSLEPGRISYRGMRTHIVDMNMIAKTEKLRGPRFRKRWHPHLGEHCIKISKYRFHPHVGAPKCDMAVPHFALTFRDHLDESGSRFVRIRFLRGQKQRRSVKAEHSFFFTVFLIKRRIVKIRVADHVKPPVHNLFLDMLGSEALKAYVRESRANGKKLYAALSNNDWVKDGENWYCSMRGAGRIVADLRNKYEWYLDFFCSGNEGDVSPEIAALLGELGWSVATEAD